MKYILITACSTIMLGLLSVPSYAAQDQYCPQEITASCSGAYYCVLKFKANMPIVPNLRSDIDPEMAGTYKNMIFHGAQWDSNYSNATAVFCSYRNAENKRITIHNVHLTSNYQPDLAKKPNQWGPGQYGRRNCYGQGDTMQCALLH